MKRSKVIGASVLIGLLVIIMIQNTASVSTKVLFWSFSLPRAVLLFVTAAIGYAAGGIVFTRRKRN